MDEDWENIVANYKKAKSNKLIFIKTPSIIKINNITKPSKADFLSNLVENNDRKFVRNFEPEYKLDLHGFNKEQAFNELMKFISLNYQNQNKKIIVITGKGIKNGEIGVLRSCIGEWLNNPKIRYMIASFSKASEKYGGTGAFFISLKKNI